MWISSLVVALPSELDRAHAITDALKSIAVFTLGEAQGGRLPVVIEAADGATSRYWYQWVEALPGVQHVELAFVSFDETGDSSTTEYGSEADLQRATTRSELAGIFGDEEVVR